MQHRCRPSRRLAAFLLALAFLLSVRAISAIHDPNSAVHDPADSSIRQFLAQEDVPHAYLATRRLEGENGDRTAWLEAVTEYAPGAGFRYEITAEGGSDYIRTKVLRAVLNAERDAIAEGVADRSALAQSNYSFQANGVDANGLANILLSPRRKERVLVAGTLFLRPEDGALVRLQGRLAKSPSFWVKNVHIVRCYDRISGVVVPVEMELSAQLRLFGSARLRMTYAYSQIDGRPVFHGGSS